MKSKLRYILYCLISIYGLYFISACCIYCYQIWDGTKWAHQEYTMDSMSLESFKSKYLEYCQSDKVIKTFCSPYHNNTEIVDFISQEKEGIIHCSFFSYELKVLMNFYVEKGSVLKIYYWGIIHSCDSNLTPKEYAKSVNGGNESWSTNERYIKAFEKEVLTPIGKYRRSVLQGFLCWYPFFFVKHFFYVCLLGAILFFLIIYSGKTVKKW